MEEERWETQDMMRWTARGIGEDGMGERKEESECYEVGRMTEERSKIGSGVDEHKWR